MEDNKNELMNEIPTFDDESENPGSETTEVTPYSLAALSTELQMPYGYIINEDGIARWDESNKKYKKISFAPLAITRIYELDGNEEVELAIFIRNEWKRIDVSKSELCSNASLAKILSANGLLTPQPLAADISMYLAVFESVNTIPVIKCLATCGWPDQENFLPYAAPNYILHDADGNGQTIRALHTHGDLDCWVTKMNKLRKNMVFRFILAASFAAPLLEIVGVRSFFIYNWCTSGKGKTAALHAALSVWGKPDDLIQTFNATSVGLERRAAFFNGLPLGMDERQIAGGDDASQKKLESIVYNLSNGVGKTRGAREGGLQELATWKTIVLSTGEQPLITSSSQDGVSNRTLELSDPPFDEGATPGDVYDLVKENYGLAGEQYIKAIVKTNKDFIKCTFDEIREAIQARTDISNGSHLNDLAVVALADHLAGVYVFGTVAIDESVDMALEIGKMIEVNSRRDVNMQAVDTIYAWIAANTAHFCDYSSIDFRQEPYFGFANGVEREICVFPDALNTFLTKAGYNYDKTVKYMREKGIIKAEQSKNTVKRSCQKLQFAGRVICIMKKSFDAFIDKGSAADENKTKDTSVIDKKTAELPDCSDSDGPDETDLLYSEGKSPEEAVEEWIEYEDDELPF